MQDEKFQNLLRILKLTGGKFIIVEDGEPQAVLLSFEEFEKLAVSRIAQGLSVNLAKIEEINEEITRAQLADLRAEVIVEEPEVTIEPLDQLL